MRFFAVVATILSFATIASANVPCGDSFGSFVGKMKREALRKGHSKATVDRFFAGVRQDSRTLKADRSQGIFRMSFLDFSRRIISQNRIDNGRRNARKWDAVFDSIERNYGVSRGVLLAFWALETDYGAVQGDFNTLNSLMTLAHNCRRPDLFRPQVFSALELYEQGSFDPSRTTGAWAGEVGMVQMLPGDILENGVDADGNGRVDLKTSPPDALHSGAKMLRGLGWRPNEPWLQEVVVPQNLDWTKTGLDTQLTVSQWAKMGVKTEVRETWAGQAQRFGPASAGSQRPCISRVSEFQRLFRMEQKLRLCDHGGLFRDTPKRCRRLYRWQSRPGTFRFPDEAPAKETCRARP